MRKHTRSWMIKIIFGVIIIVFIFFFGYSQMQKGGPGGPGGGVAARVNGDAISYGRYKMALEDVQGYYEKIFKDKIPEQMWPQIRQTALLRVIDQALFVQLGDKLGISVTPEELLDNISHNPSFQQDGSFDPIAYKKFILPYFENRYGINYEDVLKKDLTTAKVINFLTGNVTISDAEAKKAYDKEKSTWTFDRIATPDKTVATEVLESIKTSSAKNLESLVKKHDLKKERLENITISTKNRLIPETAENETIIQILSLTKEAPTTPAPIQAGSNFYLFRLVDIKEPGDAEWEKSKNEFTASLLERKKQDYVMEWQENLKKDAEIEQYVLDSSPRSE